MSIYDLEKLKKFVEVEIHKLQNPENADDIEKFKISVNIKSKEIIDQSRIIIEPSIQQQYYYAMAGFITVGDERKAYYLCLALRLVYKTKSITTLLKEALKDDYDDIMDELDKYFRLSGEIKNTLDLMLEDEKIRTNINHPLTKRYFKLCQELPLIYDLPFYVLGIILEHTNLGTMKVPQNAMLIYTQQYKKIEYKNEQQKTRDKEFE